MKPLHSKHGVCMCVCLHFCVEWCGHNKMKARQSKIFSSEKQMPQLALNKSSRNLFGNDQSCIEVVSIILVEKLTFCPLDIKFCLLTLLMLYSTPKVSNSEKNFDCCKRSSMKFVCLNKPNIWPPPSPPLPPHPTPLVCILTKEHDLTKNTKTIGEHFWLDLSPPFLAYIFFQDLNNQCEDP